MRVLKLIYKNMFRHKLRTSLTVLGIAIAVTSFVLLRTVLTAWYEGVDASAVDRLIVRHSVSFIFPLPYSYKERIMKVPGVKDVTFATWFGGVYIDKKQFFARMAVEADNFFEVYPEMLVPKDQLEAFKAERNSCIVGDQLVSRYNLKVGDIMSMDGDIFPGKWDFVIRGIYHPRDKSTDPSNMVFHWQNLDERMKQEWPRRAGLVGWYVVKIDHPDASAAVSGEIDKLFANSSAETKTETERAFSLGFLSGASAVITAINVLSFVIIGIILLVLGNTMIMAARERAKEYAVLKTLGFSAFHLIGLIAGESLAIAAIGGAVGLVLSMPLVQGFEAALPKGWFPVFEVKTITLVLAVSGAVMVGVLASIFPIQRAVSTKIVDALRQVG
jgi:putative ABC transport system permease protein